MNFLKNQLFFTQKSNNGRWESSGNIRENIFRKIKKIPQNTLLFHAFYSIIYSKYL